MESGNVLLSQVFPHVLNPPQAAHTGEPNQVQCCTLVRIIWKTKLSDCMKRKTHPHGQVFLFMESGNVLLSRYRQVLCANSFTNLAELRLHRAEEPALDCPIAEGRVSVKGGEAACEALDASSGFCYQPASSSCSSGCFMLMYFFPPHWVPAT